MTNVPFTGLPVDWPEFTPEQERQIDTWVRLVALQKARELGEVPNVEKARFVAGMLYERERRNAEPAR
jgi:hypothetical protein